MIELIYLLRIGLAVLLGLIIGLEREQQDKNAGLRTILLIMLGACLITVFSLNYVKITKEIGISFDAIRAIAYYIVAIGFVGGNIVGRKQGKVSGLTTSAVLLPTAVIGFLCGTGEYILAIVATILIYGILKLKYLKIKIQLIGKKKRNIRIVRAKAKSRFSREEAKNAVIVIKKRRNK